MHLSPAVILSTALFALTASANAVSPPSLTYLFTARLSLGQPPNPIPIPGGVRIIEPILNGTISGPAATGIIYPATATLFVYENNTLYYPRITLGGMTNDNQTFIVEENGVGSRTSQYSNFVITVGGKYAYLSKNLIIGSLKPNYTGHYGTIELFCVECKCEDE